MRVLVVSDIHGDVETLKRIVNRESDEYELILVLGDITDVSLDDYLERAEEVINVLDQQGTFVKAIPGNMDDEDVLRLLIEHRINLHKDTFSLQDCDFVGFGGGTTPFDTPFEPSDEERGTVLKTLLQRTSSPNRVVVSHHPPKNTRIDRTADGEQVGSQELRDIIETGGVRLVLSGHIHEAVGQDELNGTVMVNPGPVNEGRYALIDIGEEITIELKQR